MNLAAEAPQWLVLLLGILLIAAAAEDVWRLRISNLTSGAILLGAIVAIVIVGPRLSLWQNGAVFVLLLVIGTFAFSAGILGGGDVKLLATTGLWFDFSGAVRMLLAVAIIGGLLTILVVAIRQFSWNEKRRETTVVLRKKGGIPYGVAIAAGAMTTIAMLGSTAP